MNSLRVGLATVALALVACSDAGQDQPALLTEQNLDGEWRDVTTEAESQAICDQAVPSREGADSATRVQLLSEPDQRTLVIHELIEYRTSEAAEAAISTVSAAAECAEFTRADGDSTAAVQVDEIDVPGHGETVALQLLIMWADGTGQGYLVTATQYGNTVSYLTVDAVQGGVPGTDDAATFLDAVESS